VIPKFIRAALLDETLTVYGDGEQSRDFTYVSNVVAANILAAESDAGVGEVFNFACGDRITLNGMIGVLEEFVGRELKKRYDPPRPGDVPHSQADISKFRTTLGFGKRICHRTRHLSASFFDGCVQAFLDYRYGDSFDAGRGRIQAAA